MLRRDDVKPTAPHRRVRKDERDEQGASLILVLIFTLVASLTVGGLLTALQSDLANSNNFASARSLEYDASTAINLAIQSIRYTPLLAPGQTLNASPPQPCWAAGPSGTYGSGYHSHNVSADGVDIAVWCSTAWFPTTATTRVVTISACQATTSNSACAENPILQSVVTFDDYPVGVGEPSYGQCVVYCGAGLTVNSWLLYPTVPAVTGISPTSGSVTGGGTITITGSGFAEHSTVNFIEESGGTPTTDNVAISVPSTSVNSSGTQAQATVPCVVEGSTYFVTVSTPTGTSADGQVYTFTTGTPQITAVTSTPASSPLGGPSTGGTAVTITGNNFVIGDAVNFVQESGGQPVQNGAVVGATSVTVSRTGANTVEITALAPPIAIGSTYFVSVASPHNGSAANGSGNVFTYQTVVPTVNIISPTSGNSSTSISIYGTGFQSDAVVSFVPESNGQPTGGTTLTASSVTYTSSDLISAVPPSSIQHGTTYFVTVSIPGIQGQSSYFPVFTAS
jgi:large repetitive protein